MEPIVAADGCCFFVSKSMINSLKHFIDKNTAGCVFSVYDFSFKLNVAGFQLGVMAFVFKRFCSRKSEWWTEAMPFAFAWAPADDEESWNVVLISVIDCYHNLGINLLGAFGPAFWHDSAIGRAVHVCAFGKRTRFRCLKNCHPGNPSVPLPVSLPPAFVPQRQLISVHCQFISSLFSKLLVHLYIEAWQNELVLGDPPQLPLVQFAKERVFTTDERGRFGAEFLCGPHTNLPPGFTSGKKSISRSLYKFRDAVNRVSQTISGQSNDIETVTQTLEEGLASVMQNSGGTVAGADLMHVQPKSVHSKSLTERVRNDQFNLDTVKPEREIRYMPAPKQYLQHYPGNYQVQWLPKHKAQLCFMPGGVM